MTQRRIRVSVAAAALLTAATLAGCGDDSDSTDATATALPLTTSQTSSAPPATMTEVDDEAVTTEAAQQLCDMIGAELDNWRDQGPVVARVSFNGTVQNWAARNDGLNDEIIGDTGLVDVVTTETCPEVRTQAIEVLDTDTLAGFGE